MRISYWSSDVCSSDLRTSPRARSPSSRRTPGSPLAAHPGAGSSSLHGMQDSSALYSLERRRGDGRCSTGTSSVTPLIRLLWFSVRQQSLEDARFLVETLCTRMQRDEIGRAPV